MSNVSVHIPAIISGGSRIPEKGVGRILFVFFFVSFFFVILLFNGKSLGDFTQTLPTMQESRKTHP